MKLIKLIFFITLFNAHLYGQVLNHESLNTSSTKNSNSVPGACNDRTCVNLKDGNGTLGQIYSNSACGLNYVQASQKVTTRYATPPGSGLPVTLNITGIPTCFQIEQAYLWWIFAGTSNSATATVTNPLGSSQTYNATLAGSGPAKCWSEGGTRLFRADVTNLISGNGNYTINLNTSVWGTDGVTLFIIYRDLSATYTGNLYINDGLRVQNGGGQNQTMNFPAACQAGSNGRAFSIVSDMQDNVGATHQATHNGTNINFPSNFYNFDQSNTTINAGQSTANFGYNKGGDCWAWGVMGIYFQTNCVTCTPAIGTPSVASVSQTNICSGQSVTASLNPVPAGLQWQSAPTSSGPWTNIAGATSSPYNSGPLTSNICYRAFYPSTCGTDTSNVVCVTVDGLSTAPTGAMANPNFICESQTVTLNVVGGSLANGATWQWYSGSCGGTSIGSGATITVTPTTTTTYFVRAEGLCNTTACASLTVTVANKPTALFTASTPCFPNATTFTDNSVPNSSGGLVSWNWDFGNNNTSTLQNPSFQFASYGNYVVTLIVTNADDCADTVSQTVTVHEKPVADFNFTNQCDGTAIPFTSTSTISSGNITNYSWDFGNNNTGTGASTSHLYANPGTYNVTHTVVSNNGCSDTITQMVTVYNNPIASFAHQNVCLGNAMNFSNTSTVAAPDVIDNYLWVFGDGSPTSNQTHPSHTYLNSGTYNVTLITTTSNGCSDVTNVNVSVFDAPTANFNFNNECENIAVLFNNTSLNPTMGTIGSYSWNFGDGSPINTTSFNPIHIYTNAGTYTVTLIVNSSNLGCADTLQQTIDIYPSPTANFTFQNQCFGNSITFTDQSIGAVSYNWNFGNNNSSNLQNPQHNYTAAGNYNVSLTVESANGCTNTTSHTVTVYPKPNANFSATEVCHGNPTDFSSTSTVSSPASIISYFWDFGDGSSVVSTNPASYTYMQPGQYSVSLIVVTDNNCTDTITLPVIVNPNPDVDFVANITSGCTPLCVNFTNNSTISSGNIANYLWTFEQGANSSSINPSYCFINEGLSEKYFSIILKATSDKGCETTVVKNNYMVSYPLPIADFNFTPTETDVFNPVIYFMDASIGASTWLWNFGDNSNSSDSISQNPIHTYADSGLYTIWQYVTNVYGCSDSISKSLQIKPGYALYIPNAFTPNGDSHNATFTAKGYGVKEYIMYIFNRWGELIFVSDDINKGWDGTYLGIPSQQDVYVYRIETIDLNNKKHSYYGNVSLIR